MNLIVMLTHNDITVKNAIEVFEECKDLPVQHWGFKNVGLPTSEMKKLVETMKKAGKSTHLEVVSYDEQECLEAAKLAVECQFDFLLGTTYYPKVIDYIKEYGKSLKYFPFCGKVWGSPSVLGNTIDDIISDAERYKELGIDGTDLLAYRFIGDVEKLLREFVKKVKFPVIIAGSIDTDYRMDIMKELNPWGFTMGSALFNKKMVKDGSFRENLMYVVDYLKK